MTNVPPSDEVLAERAARAHAAAYDAVEARQAREFPGMLVDELKEQHERGEHQDMDVNACPACREERS